MSKASSAESNPRSRIKYKCSKGEKVSRVRISRITEPEKGPEGENRIQSQIGEIQKPENLNQVGRQSQNWESKSEHLSRLESHYERSRKPGKRSV